MTSNPLKKQLEMVRFEKTMDYVRNSAGGAKRLNSGELAHLNQMLTAETTEPWRMEPVTLSLPSGKQDRIAVISNSQMRAGDFISSAREQAHDGDLANAAAKLYRDLVVSHLFNDANRRTAVLAVSWLLLEYGVSIPSVGLLELGAGDLREEGPFQALKQLIQYSIQVKK
ncbi:MAG: Fic family protein [Bdellovibrionales bacterium]